MITVKLRVGKGVRYMADILYRKSNLKTYLRSVLFSILSLVIIVKLIRTFFRSATSQVVLHGGEALGMSQPGDRTSCSLAHSIAADAGVDNG